MTEIKYANILSVRIDWDKSAEDIITVLCPYCGEAHKHRSSAKVERDARCGAGKYTPRDWPEPPTRSKR